MDHRLKEKYPNSDEIDLFELVLSIWARRRLIILCVIVGFSLAVAYALLAAEKWTSVAYVNQPRISHIADYLDQRRTLARADGNYTVDRHALASSLFGEFIRQTASTQNKRTFLQNSSYFDDLPDTATSQQRALLLEEAARNIVIEQPEEDQINPYYVVSASAVTPDLAHDMLAQYLAYSNGQAIQVFDSEFRDSLMSSILTRRTERDLIERELTTKRRNNIEELTAALETARAAGVMNYMGGRTVSGSVIVELAERQRLFMLGETYLAAELKTAQESPIVYPLRYYEIEEQLALLEPLLDYRAPQVQAYQYQLEPTVPLRRDSPRRSLIAVLGIVLGGMIGVFLALIHSAVHSRKVRATSTAGSSALAGDTV